MIKAVIRIIVFASLLTCGRESYSADNKPPDLQRLFYEANAYYEKRDYSKAIESYRKILDLGLESGALYYNIGNGFFKLNKMGYAILWYERAKRLIPGDKDLKSNLEYAKGLIEEAPAGETASAVVAVVTKVIKLPLKDLNLDSLALLTFLLYAAAALIWMLGISGRTLEKRLSLPYFLTLGILALVLAVFILRYYDEEMVSRGIVVQAGAEVRYEPIDKSTTYYKIYEGQKVVLLTARNGWRKIRRPDGKIGWVEKGALEEI